MLDRKTRTIQKQVKSAGEELLKIQEEIGALIEAVKSPDDPGAAFRCRLVLNKCRALEERLTLLSGELPLRRETVISHSMIMQNKQLLNMQKNTVSQLYDCIRMNNRAMLDAKRASLLTEAMLIGERIKKNGKGNPS